MNEAQQHGDPIDALTAMASQRENALNVPNQSEAVVDSPRRDTVDALAAMADGEDLTSSQAITEQPQTEEADVQTSGGEPVSTVSPAPGASAARKTQAVSAQKRGRQAHGVQFRKTMVPILLITGLLLFVLGGIVAAMLGDQGVAGDYYYENKMEDPAFQKILVWVAFPLGAMLLAGAWFFHVEAKRAEKGSSRR